MLALTLEDKNGRKKLNLAILKLQSDNFKLLTSGIQLICRQICLGIKMT